MNKSILVNSLLNMAGLGAVSVDSIMEPVTSKVTQLRDLQLRCYAESDSLLVQVEQLKASAKALLEEGDRAGKVAAQLESVVL